MIYVDVYYCESCCVVFCVVIIFNYWIWGWVDEIFRYVIWMRVEYEIRVSRCFCFSKCIGEVDCVVFCYFFNINNCYNEFCFNYIDNL